MPSRQSSTSPLYEPPARSEGSVGWKARQVRQSASSIAVSAFAGSSVRRKTDQVQSIEGQRGQSPRSREPYAAATTVPGAFQTTAVQPSGDALASGPWCFREWRQLTWSYCSSHTGSCPSKARELRLRCSCSSRSGVHASRNASSSRTRCSPPRGAAACAFTCVSDCVSVVLVFGCCVRWLDVSRGSVCVSASDAETVSRQLELTLSTGSSGPSSKSASMGGIARLPVGKARAKRTASESISHQGYS